MTQLTSSFSAARTLPSSSASALAAIALPSAAASPAPLTAAQSGVRGKLRAFLSSSDSIVPTVLRLSLGGVIFAHGLQKVFGWFGGYGLSGTMGFFASLGMPAPLGALVILSDFLGALSLMAGLATRFSAAAAGAVMLGAALLVHAPNGLFMNWGGAPHGEGYEFHLLAMAMAASLVLSGGGRGSVDRWLSRRWLATTSG
jgi:putative oxidoreductase